MTSCALAQDLPITVCGTGKPSRQQPSDSYHHALADCSYQTLEVPPSGKFLSIEAVYSI